VDDQGPVELKIHVNGIVLGNRSGTGTQSEVSFDEVIRLVAGLNVIEVTANDPEGSSQTETVRITYVPEPGEASDGEDPADHETESGKNK
jgi:hypothetical protein